MPLPIGLTTVYSVLTPAQYGGVIWQPSGGAYLRLLFERDIFDDTLTFVSMSWNGYAMRARDEKPSIAYVYPKEGNTGWMDNIAVPKGAPHLETAKA